MYNTGNQLIIHSGVDCYAAEQTLSIEDAVDDSLYYEGAVYVFSYLENEIETGIVC